MPEQELGLRERAEVRVAELEAAQRVRGASLAAHEQVVAALEKAVASKEHMRPRIE